MERNRTRGAYTTNPLGIAYLWNTSQNPKPTPATPSQFNANGTVESMVDTLVPNFHKRQASGEVFFNPLVKTEVTPAYNSIGPIFSKYTAPNTYWAEFRYNWSPVHPNGAMTDGRPVPSLSNLITEVQTRALANVRPPSYQALVTAGEFAETMRYLKNPLHTGRKLAEAFTKRINHVKSKHGFNPREVVARNQKNAAIISELENLYVEFRYGVRPLIYDTSQFLLALSESKPSSNRQTYRAQGNDVFADAWTSTNIVNGSLTCDIDYNYTRNAIVRSGYLYEIMSGITAPEKWGLDLGQLPRASWELVPLSFIADWFFNVGDFISAITPVAGQKQLGNWVSIETTEVCTARCYNWRYSTGWTRTSDGSGTDSWKRVIKKRYPADATLPNIVLRPNWTAPFKDVSRLLDMVAITHQRLRSQGPQFKEEFFF